MPTFTPYDSSSLGPSRAAGMDYAADLAQVGSKRNTTDYNIKMGLSNYGFGTPKGQQGTLPALQSSIGAAGQESSGAGDLAVQMAKTQHLAQNADITTQFQRAQTDLQRQQVYAAMGLIL